MKKALKAVIPVLTLFLLISACSSNEVKEEGGDHSIETMVEDTTPIDELADFRFSYTIANLPSPFQVLDEFAQSDLPVNPNLLNPSKNAENYHSLFKLAFNYGIYGVDLGYAVVNNRTPEILMYYPTVRDISQQLDIGESFDEFAIRFEENSEDPDSLTKILDEAYAATDEYLRNSQRLKIASLILAGSWLECQHICVNLLREQQRTESNEILYQRIFEQRLHLENVTNILSEFNDDEEVAAVHGNLQNLLTIYQRAAGPEDINIDFLNELSSGLEVVRNQVIN
jgi:hypothetical protein